MLEGFDAPVFPKILKLMNAILWSKHYKPSQVREIMEDISQDQIDLRRIEFNLETSDGYSWPIVFFHSLKYSSVEDSAILFPHCQQVDLQIGQVRSVAICLNCNLAGNRRYAVQNALGELLIDLSVGFVELDCGLLKYAEA